jgi:hypothetical protein
VARALMESGNKASKFLLDVCITFGIQSDILEIFHLRNHCENYKDELEEFKILKKKSVTAWLMVSKH